VKPRQSESPDAAEDEVELEDEHNIVW
jgi:hypothetical protein